MKKLLLILSFITYPLFQVYSQIIVTDAGNGTAGYSGDAGQATAAEIHSPTGVTTDASGNIYICDNLNSRIRKINTSGVISTFAGNGTAGFSGNGGQATAAEINSPKGIIVDASGNVYFSDQSNQVIRKINTSGVISTFAGDNMGSYSGDGGQATAAGIHNPTGLAVDGSGNIYIADQSNARVRKVNTFGVISTFAGNGTVGFSGDGGQATAAEIRQPNDVVLDASGNLYIADGGSNRIRKVNTSGVISTFAGIGSTGFSGDGGQASAAELHSPSSVKVDGSGNVYIVDNANERVREINSSGIINTVTGNGTAGYSGDGSQATAAEIDNPAMMCFDALGNYYIADNSNQRVREVYLYINVTTSVLTNVSCNGGSNGSASATPSRGTSPYTYSWTGGQTTSTATGLSAGTYTITVTDSKSLTGTATATITQPTALSVTATSKSASVCPGNSDSLKCTPSGGVSPYTYNWLPAPYADMSCSTCQNTQVYPFGTTFTITVTDANGCTATASTSITVLPFPYTTIVGTVSPICPGAHDTLVATGASTYAWSTGATTSSIIVSPSVSTTYTLEAKNSYGCSDSLQYVVDTDCIGNGNSSSGAIRIVPSTSCNPSSFTSYDSAAWFYFTATDSNNQIVAISYPIGIPVPHVHRLTLYDSALNMIEDEHLPDINGATELRIDASHLKIGHKYLVCAARTGAHSNTPGCNPTPTPTGICNESMKWNFEICFRSFPVFIPKDSGSETPDLSQLYYENRGQVLDMNNIPRFDIKAYTNNSSPAVYLSDSAVSFVSAKPNNNPLLDTIQRVDMLPAGSAVQPTQRMFKMEKDSSAGYLNYLLGFIPNSNGVTNVYGYSRAVYKSIYTNIDMHVYSSYGGTKFYFVCNTGGTTHPNPANIELKFNGANSINVTSDSGLDIVTSFGTISFAPGFAYEDSAGIIVAKSWKANFEKVSANVVRFHTGVFNTSEPLIIEVDRGHPSRPATGSKNIKWSTFFDSDGRNIYPGKYTYTDELFDISTDGSGNVYTTGFSMSKLFPTLNGIQMNKANGAIVNAVIAKFNKLDILKWATYYGGDANDIGYSIKADASGNVYVTGTTNSTNFPLFNPGGGAYYQSTLNNLATDVTDFDAFIVKLDSTGKKNLWSTYYGGKNASERGNHLTLDGQGNLYVVGGGLNYSATSTFPLLSSTNGGTYNNTTYGEGFILEFTTNGVREWATRMGGKYTDSTSTLNGCAADSSRNFFVTGSAQDSGYTTGYSLTFPFRAGTCSCVVANAVATKFDKNNNIVWSTYYGGNLYEAANAITIDPAGNSYITGVSYSDSAITGLGIQIAKLPYPAYNLDASNESSIGSFNAFIAEFTSSGSLHWSTYFGGHPDIAANAISVDANNILFITGYLSPASVVNNFPFPSPNAANSFDQDSVFGYTGVGACGLREINAFIAGFDNARYVWGTEYGPSYGYGLSDYKGTDLYIVGNGGVTIASPSPCFIPMPLDAGPDSPFSWFQTKADSGGCGPFIAQFDISPIITAGVEELDKTAEGITVFPNPTFESVTIQMNLAEKESVEFILYNILGQVVYSNIIYGAEGKLSHPIPLSSMASGSYILQVKSGVNIYHAKIIKIQ